jgi:hypothetical protein
MSIDALIRLKDSVAEVLNERVAQLRKQLMHRTDNGKSRRHKAAEAKSLMHGADSLPMEGSAVQQTASNVSQSQNLDADTGANLRAD